MTNTVLKKTETAFNQTFYEFKWCWLELAWGDLHFAGGDGNFISGFITDINILDLNDNFVCLEHQAAVSKFLWYASTHIFYQLAHRRKIIAFLPVISRTLITSPVIDASCFRSFESSYEMARAFYTVFANKTCFLSLPKTFDKRFPSAAKARQ